MYVQEDLDRIYSVLQKEARPSLGKALAILGKLVAVTVFGFALIGRCNFGFPCLGGTSDLLLVPSGVAALAVAAAWVDAILEECSRKRFFPNAALNKVGVVCFRWQYGLVAAALFFTVGSFGAALKYAMLPLALMKIASLLEPSRFSGVRNEVLKAENLVQQLVQSQSPKSMTELVQIDRIPVYRLGRVASVLRGVAADFDANDKKNVCVSTPSAKSSRTPALSMLFAPFHFVANEIFLWEGRDVWVYFVIAIFLIMSYIGSYHIFFTPASILFPLLGPKSRAGRYVRALQEDLLLAQGRDVEKKGGMVPTYISEWAFPLNWPMIIYIGGTHVMALWALVVIFFFQGVCPIMGAGKAMKTETFVFAFIMYIFGGLGITAGAHRLWAHRSYKAGIGFRFFMMVCNSIANQGTIVHWARDHRTHHQYSDTIADPHDANRGFFFSHAGWLLTKKRPEVYQAGKSVNMSDIYADPVCVFQKKADPFWNLLWCFAFPAFMALNWGDSMWNGFLLAGILRYTVILNATWAVNSVVHAWGARPYNASHLTTENGWVSLFALGEGWHNWHHAFPWDYACSELGVLLQYNPTKLFLDVCAKLGLVWDLKRADKAWKQRKARWEQSNGRKVEESLEGPWLFRRRVVTFGPADYGGDGPLAPSQEEDETAHPKLH